MNTTRKAAATRSGPKKTRPPRTSSASDIERQWQHWHRGDCEPFPNEKTIKQLAEGNRGLARLIDDTGGLAAYCRELLGAWGHFHAGRFEEAIECGDRLGALGASAANKAAGVFSLYPGTHEEKVTRLLEQAVQRGERAVTQLPDYPNAHYALALVMGRYSQRISILKALAEGLGGKVHTHLERTLVLEPRHAEAQIALGLYHAEIVAKLGALAARLTYGASAQNAQKAFERAIELTPDSPIALMEYARGLKLLDLQAHDVQARKLLTRAAACHPGDAMERLDAAQAKRTLKDMEG